MAVIMQISETHLNQELPLSNMDDHLKSREINLLINILKWVMFLLLVLYSYTKTLKNCLICNEGNINARNP